MTRAPSRAVHRLAPLACFVALLTTAATAQPLQARAKYVALGSSFAAGPGVPTRAVDSPTLCARSDANYAHLLAAKRGLALDDRTCTGATTADILTKAQAGQPRQIDGVDAATELVTVTIGGNDISYLGNLWAESCGRAPDRVPAAWKPYICTVTPPAAIDRATAVLPDAMRQVVADIRQRAPKAKIVFVDYMDILPSQGACPARAPLSEEQMATARTLAARLLGITRRIAEQEHVTLVSAKAATAGHDVCAAEPWLFDFTFPATPETFGPIAYHPNAKAMHAIADAIDHVL